MSRQNKDEGHLCGILKLDKPAGMTSHDAVQRIRRIFSTRKVGHAGTLDPLATGMLPLLLGDATRFSEYLLHLDKEYEVVARLGVMTDTQDIEGRVLSESAIIPSESLIKEELLKFLGETQQIPPMYSAIKMNGRPLYALARQGQIVDRPSRLIRVDSISDIHYEYPLLRFRLSVSSGTYVRTICHDLGCRLESGATVVSLRRLRVGSFYQNQMASLEELEHKNKADLMGVLCPLNEAFSFLPSIHVLEGREERVLNGQSLGSKDYQGIVNFNEGMDIAMFSTNSTLLAMGKAQYLQGDWRVVPKRVIPANSLYARMVRENSFIS